MSTFPALPLRRSYPAVAASVPRVRRTLAAFASASDAGAEQVEAIRLAVSEAMTDAVVRCADSRGRIRVTAALVSDEMAVEIAEEDGAAGPRPVRTRQSRLSSPIGLALIAHSTDEMAIVTRPLGGTELRMRFGLRGLSRRR